MTGRLLILLLLPVSLLLATSPARGDEASKRKAKSSSIEVEIVGPEPDAEFQPRSVHKCRINIKCDDERRVPSRYNFAFHHQGKQLLDGEFIAESKVSDDKQIYCEVIVKAPKHPGKYKLVVSPIPIRSLSKTDEEKLSVETAITVAKPKNK